MTTTKTPRLTTTDRNTLRDFAAMADAVATARAALDAAERALTSAENDALAILASKGPQIVNGRSFTVGQKISVKTTAPPEALADFARANGLKISPPAPETCATATIRAACLRGLDVSPVADVNSQPIVVIG